MTDDAQAVLELIQKQGSTATDDARFVRTMQTNQFIRQGDLYIRRLDPKSVDKKSLKPFGSFQLAPGTTKGSRHIAEGATVLEAPSSDDPLVGPIVFAKQRWNLLHPEHSDVSLPSGTYEVTYQRDHAAEERARVMD